MKRLIAFFGILGILGISGCGGGASGANGDDPFDGGTTDPVIALSVQLLSSTCQSVASASFDADENICVQATLTSDGAAQNNQVVEFATSSTLGTLSASSALTNSSGIAEIIISNPNFDVGATTLTATFNETSATGNYEYLAIPATVVQSPEISINLFRNGNAVSRFQAGDSAQLQATLLNEQDEPIADAIVEFSITGVGPELTPSSALTNDSGVAQVTVNTADTDLGAFIAQATATVSSTTISASANFEVQASDTIIEEGETRFGYIDNAGVFVEGVIGSTAEDANGNVTISAGATAGFSVALVDETGQRIQTPTAVTFSSTCVTNNQATIDTIVTTINGVASSTFEDLSCAGSSGNTDQIIASVVINNTTTTLSRELTIQPENIGSITFVSAAPEEIVLQGTGGQNSASISTLTFQVNGELGNPLSQQEVNFSLNTSTGGLSIEPQTGLTNSQGQVTTRVSAGNVPTAVRVTAETVNSQGTAIRTQSDLLSVNTGLPDQNSFSISASVLNPQAFNNDGISSVITVRMSDSFNNPVPNGTTVSFTTEGGQIQPSCITGTGEDGTVNPNSENTGTCSVTWTSSAPRPVDHRVTILATAIGHETLIDSNGNNTFDNNDGGPLSDGNDNGFATSIQEQTGFVDHSEAWRDDNENGIRDPFEIFLDYNSDESFNTADGLFNGPQCENSSLCGTGNAASLHVRRSLLLIMSSSQAYWRVYNGDITDINNVVFDNDPNIDSPNALNLGTGETADLSLVYYDTANQVLPNGTQVGTVDIDGIILTVLDSVPNTNQSEVPGIPGNVYYIGLFSGATTFNAAIDTPIDNDNPDDVIRTTVAFSVTAD